MKKAYDFKLDSHPNFTERKSCLDPYQKGLLKKPDKRAACKKEIGDIFEKKVSDSIKEAFPEVVVLDNVYFETGEYIKELLLYKSIQVDSYDVFRRIENVRNRLLFKGVEKI